MVGAVCIYILAIFLAIWNTFIFVLGMRSSPNKSDILNIQKYNLASGAIAENTAENNSTETLTSRCSAVLPEKQDSDITNNGASK